MLKVFTFSTKPRFSLTTSKIVISQQVNLRRCRWSVVITRSIGCWIRCTWWIRTREHKTHTCEIILRRKKRSIYAGCWRKRRNWKGINLKIGLWQMYVLTRWNSIVSTSDILGVYNWFVTPCGNMAQINTRIKIHICMTTRYHYLNLKNRN